MAIDRSIILADDGAFLVTADDRVIFLTIDAEFEAERWILCESSVSETGTSARFLSLHASLDTGLEALATHGGLADSRYRVILPCGAHFIRPGKVPAASVMAAHGYVLVRRLTAFVVIDEDDSADPEAIRLLCGRMLAGASVNVCDAEPIGVAEGWCVDVEVPFDGYAKRESFLEIAASAIAEADGDVGILECVEPSEYGPVPLHRAEVFQLFIQAA